ncbi:tRNA dihydrouridine(20/20a) synthase DusA [Ectothiorhodospira variabilis]|nr:tRNA dihydrouridine(20/20a) synthase DusA [Ectothiorhodospira variabilis]MCG5499077.1 tRNA dihydrouridine(20/20a) synthase DusA [Ectothiorhodospira variabilis]MCG5505105.1 tRNA dihydrouridine(20/20a) synthase DusA [Ectothiorhodospira variabilis]MCG5508262.1 tRNA dihydrouridine(20/20a) synthase DusA [Ectothiorhodospira variabilis]
MMEWTDRHCRYFLRLLSQRAFLYTEMVTTGALIHGDRERFLAFDPAEHPVALQLGASEPEDLARCAVMAQEAGYDEVNLNVGCPSDRVSSGRFGASLMREPERVADCVRAMGEAVDIPVTVKHRIGIDDLDSYEFLAGFVDKVASAGCQLFIVHARKAWLQGLSPKQNREIPPLCYERVHQLKADFPHLAIIINGGLTTLDACQTQLEHVDGVMVGREAYYNPGILADVDRLLYGEQGPVPTPHEVVERFVPYVEARLAEGVPLQAMTRHILGLFPGMPGARAWRRHISENAHRDGAGVEVILEALGKVRRPEMR